MSYLSLIILMSFATNNPYVIILFIPLIFSFMLMISRIFNYISIDSRLKRKYSIYDNVHNFSSSKAILLNEGVAHFVLRDNKSISSSPGVKMYMMNNFIVIDYSFICRFLYGKKRFFIPIQVVKMTPRKKSCKIPLNNRVVQIIFTKTTDF